VLLCCKTKPARGGEVERARVSSNLSDHTGKFTALKALFQCEQSILSCACLDTDHPLAPFCWQSVDIGSPVHLYRAFILYPQELAAILSFNQGVFMLSRHTQRIARQSQRQPCAARITGTCKNLAMQWLIRQSRTPTRLALFR
jgi:hypothetical protein